ETPADTRNRAVFIRSLPHGPWSSSAASCPSPEPSRSRAVHSELVRSELLQSELACSRRCPLWPERPTLLSAPCGPRRGVGRAAPPRPCRVGLQPRGKPIFRSSAPRGGGPSAPAHRPLSFPDISPNAQEGPAVQKIGSIDHSRTTILIRPCLARPRPPARSRTTRYSPPRRRSRAGGSSRTPSAALR